MRKVLFIGIPVVLTLAAGAIAFFCKRGKKAYRYGRA